MTDWREQYQKIHLDCIARDVCWLTDKARHIAGYARQLSIPPIIEDAAEKLARAEAALSDALQSVRESSARLPKQEHLEAAE